MCVCEVLCRRVGVRWGNHDWLGVRDQALSDHCSTWPILYLLHNKGNDQVLIISPEIGVIYHPL